MEEKNEVAKVGQQARVFITWVLDPETGKQVLVQLPRYENHERALREAMDRLEPGGPRPPELARQEAEARMRSLYFGLRACAEHPAVGAAAQAVAQEAVTALFADVPPRLERPIDGGDRADSLHALSETWSAPLAGLPAGIGGESLAGLLESCIGACRQAYNLSAANTTPSWTRMVAVQNAVGAIDRLRTAVRTEVLYDEAVPRDLESRLFVQWDTARDRRAEQKAARTRKQARKATVIADRALLKAAKAEAKRKEAAEEKETTPTD